MTKIGLVRRVAEVMRLNNIRKPVIFPKKKLHISDDDGNKKDFFVKSTEKDVMYTVDDIEKIIDATIEVIKEQLKKGEPVAVHGFGTFGLKYRKARATKRVGTDEWIIRYTSRY